MLFISLVTRLSSNSPRATHPRLTRTRTHTHTHTHTHAHIHTYIASTPRILTLRQDFNPAYHHKKRMTHTLVCNLAKQANFYLWPCNLIPQVQVTGMPHCKGSRCRHRGYCRRSVLRPNPNRALPPLTPTPCLVHAGSINITCIHFLLFSLLLPWDKPGRTPRTELTDAWLTSLA